MVARNRACGSVELAVNSAPTGKKLHAGMKRIDDSGTKWAQAPETNERVLTS